MEFLKWIGSTLLAIAGISVGIGVLVLFFLMSAVIWPLTLILGAIVLLAFGIKEHWDTKKTHRDV